MRNIGSKLFVLLIIAAVVGGLGYAFYPEPVDADLATIERGSLLVTVDEDGKTRIREKYVVSAPLAGRLQRMSASRPCQTTGATSQMSPRSG